MPDDAPVWVPLMFKSFDKLTQRMVDLYSKVCEVGTKFDTFKSDVNTQIADFKSEVNKNVEDLDFESQKEEIAKLETKLRNAIKAQGESISRYIMYLSSTRIAENIDSGKVFETQETNVDVKIKEQPNSLNLHAERQAEKQ